MKHDYQQLMEQLHAPAELRDRVLSAARRQGRKNQTVWRVAVCAALALTLVLGGVRLRPADETMEASGTLTCELGLTAYAEQPGANGGVFLHQVEGQTPKDLDGTTQSLAITFADGREETGTYYLRRENLGTFINEDGTEVLVPVLSGDTAETVTGLYAMPETESRWLLWPVEDSNTVSLSNTYGYRVAPGGQGGTFHAGIDIPAERGTPVLAAAEGTVLEADFDTDRGNYLILDHGGNIKTVYAHCLRLAVAAGDTVAAGQEIAAVGSTGMSTGPHLHFEVRQDEEAQNPVAYFSVEIRDTLRMG